MRTPRAPKVVSAATTRPPRARKTRKTRQGNEVADSPLPPGKLGRGLGNRKRRSSKDVEADVRRRANMERTIVLKLQHRSNIEIAKELGVTDQTVRNYIQAWMERDPPPGVEVVRHEIRQTCERSLARQNDDMRLLRMQMYASVKDAQGNEVPKYTPEQIANLARAVAVVDEKSVRYLERLAKVTGADMPTKVEQEISGPNGGPMQTEEVGPSDVRASIARNFGSRVSVPEEKD